MPDKHTFFKSLAEFEMTDLLLTDKTDQLHKEIYHNSLALTLSLAEAKQISADEVLRSLAKIKSNIQKQLFNSNLNADLSYYLWFNEMEAQLIICLINANHTKLPLEGDMRFVETEHEVIYRFLTSHYLDGLLLGEESRKSVKQELPEEETHIWIFKDRIGNRGRGGR